MGFTCGVHIIETKNCPVQALAHSVPTFDQYGAHMDVVVSVKGVYHTGANLTIRNLLVEVCLVLCSERKQNQYHVYDFIYIIW